MRSSFNLDNYWMRRRQNTSSHLTNQTNTTKDTQKYFYLTLGWLKNTCTTLSTSGQITQLSYCKRLQVRNQITTWPTSRMFSKESFALGSSSWTHEYMMVSDTSCYQCQRSKVKRSKVGLSGLMSWAEGSDDVVLPSGHLQNLQSACLTSMSLVASTSGPSMSTGLGEMHSTFCTRW